MVTHGTDECHRPVVTEFVVTAPVLDHTIL